MINNWLILAGAIVAEVAATSALKASNNLTSLVPTSIVVIGYAIAFYLLSLTVKTIPLGIAYAIWAGAGIVLITGVGWLVYGQKLDMAAILGLALIIAGVSVIHLFSAAGH